MAAYRIKMMYLYEMTIISIRLCIQTKKCEIVYYRAPTELPDVISRRVQQGGSGRMLWGCLSYFGYGLVIFYD